jgi:hypothetical protein
MAMVYQKGTVYLEGTREKKWYGKCRIYLKGRNGEKVERTRKVVLGRKSELASGRHRRNCAGSYGRKMARMPSFLLAKQTIL